MLKPANEARIRAAEHQVQSEPQRAGEIWLAEAEHWTNEAHRLAREQGETRERIVRERLEREEFHAMNCVEYCRSQMTSLD